MAENSKREREIRTYAVRSGRMNDSSQRALTELWPHYGIPQSDSELELAELFNGRPVILEVGFGMGQATAQMASAHPEQGILACDVHPPGVAALLRLIEDSQLTNVRVVHGDALQVLSQRLPEASLAGFRAYFPDPWPKKRHHKRRFINAANVALVCSRLKPGATFHTATDWQPYAESMREVLTAEPLLRNLSNRSDGYCDRPEWRPETKFERRGITQDRPSRDLIFERL